MPTVLDTFSLDAVAWDDPNPAGGDIRALALTVGATENITTSNTYGTSGLKIITWDPYTSGRTTQGVSDAFGWAFLIGTSGGVSTLALDAAADAYRVVPAGTWAVVGAASPDLAALSGVSLTVRIYKIADGAPGARTLHHTFPAVALSTVGAADFTATATGVPVLIMAPGESGLLTFTVTATGQLGGLTMRLHLGTQPLLGAELTVTLPTPGVRTEYQETALQVIVEGVAANLVKRVRKTITGFGVATMVGTSSVTRKLRSFREFDSTMVGTASPLRKKVSKSTSGFGSVTMVGTAAPLHKAITKNTTFGSVTMVGTAERRLRVRKAATNFGATTMVGTTTLTRRLVAFREFTPTMVGTSAFSRIVTFVRRFDVTMVGTVNIRIELDIEDLPGGTVTPVTVFPPIVFVDGWRSWHVAGRHYTRVG